MPKNTRKIFASYYDVLQVTSNAKQDEIRAAYYRLAKLYHPDRNPKYMKRAQKRLQLLNEAYAALSTPEKRAAYDTRRRQKKWERVLQNVQADNDNTAMTGKDAKPFPWASIADVGWFNIGHILITNKNKGHDHHGE